MSSYFHPGENFAPTGKGVKHKGNGTNFLVRLCKAISAKEQSVFFEIQTLSDEVGWQYTGQKSCSCGPLTAQLTLENKRVIQAQIARLTQHAFYVSGGGKQKTIKRISRGFLNVSLLLKSMMTTLAYLCLGRHSRAVGLVSCW